MTMENHEKRGIIRARENEQVEFIISSFSRNKQERKKFLPSKKTAML